MQIWSCAKTVLGLFKKKIGAYGPQKGFNFFPPFTLSYGVPEPSVESIQGRFHPTFLAELRFPPLPPLRLAQALLRPV